MGRPRNADAAQTRRRILDAAIRRFGSEGLKATSLRKIGGDAGVSFATVHYYFGCKSTLYESCLDASYQELEGLRAELTTAQQRLKDQELQIALMDKELEMLRLFLDMKKKA